MTTDSQPYKPQQAGRNTTTDSQPYKPQQAGRNSRNTRSAMVYFRVH